MKNIFSSRKLCIPLMSPALRLGFTLTITLLIISSPIVMLVNPALGVASSNPTTTTTAPSTIGQDGSDFTTQAEMCCVTARPTNNIVNTNSFYDVVFLTATSGAIKNIHVTFPAGTEIPSGAFFNEAEGIGPGTVSRGEGPGQTTITYTVTNPVNVPAGTKIRLEFANINNPLNPSANYRVTVITTNPALVIIDGPTESTAYTIKQIGKNAIANNHITTPKIANGAVTTPKIADGSITSTKPAESFMKKVVLLDNELGNAAGWNPDGVTTSFTISEPGITGSNTMISISVISAVNHLCNVVFWGAVTLDFEIRCSSAPANNDALHYVVENLPAHFSP